MGTRQINDTFYLAKIILNIEKKSNETAVKLHIYYMASYFYRNIKSMVDILV